ncbi:MAG: hypothetical protein UIK37_00060 [Lachnospiraceae bacterium]|jgi:hypothetical protein|nr:hypothetical protein [Lachnospiraceae bacterium]DAI17822.1 MAG TPA: hypothetical protein [Bacteriophage sp.]
MINEQVLLRKINEQLRDMPEARNKVKRLIYSMDWVDSIKLPEEGCNHDESKDDFSHGYVAGYYDCINKIKKLNGLG